jgi:hypothetical protein
MIGLWKNTFYTFCWGLLFGAIIAIIINVIFYIYVASMVDSDKNTDLSSMLDVGFGLMLLIPIVTVVGGVIHMYYTFSQSYSYGWSDAEEKHGIADDKRLCFGKTWCNWNDM